VVRHYELILLYHYGIRPKDAIRKLGYSRSSAYRFSQIYREARKKATTVILSNFSVPPERRKKVNNLDDLNPTL